jgi:hypothetical protein
MLTVDIRISRALLDATIICPSRTCGMTCRCTGYVPAEMATFECRGCSRRFYVGLGTSPVLREESIAVEGVA